MIPIGIEFHNFQEVTTVLLRKKFYGARYSSPGIRIATYIWRMSEQIIHTDKAPEPVGAYPHARKAGNLLFLSGIGPREAGTNKIPGVELDKNGNCITFDFAAQCHSVFKNVKTVLEASGSRWEDLIDVTVFLTDMQRDFTTYNRIYAEYFTSAQPCRTTVGITALPTPIAIELKCIALLTA